MLFIGIAWNVLGLWLFFAGPPHLDTHHCWKPQPGAAIVTYCWPKNGCFVDAAGNAMCWRAEAKVRK